MIRLTAATGSRPHTTLKDEIGRTVAYYHEPQQEYR